MLIDPLHVVPETLTGEARGTDAKQSRQRRLVEPSRKTRFATGGDAAVQSGNQDILTDRRTA
jgi:hypothetical protein